MGRDFIPYEKIPESSDAWRLDTAGWRQLQKVRWVVTEKIHGANFCVVGDSNGLQYANRKEFLAAEDIFFAYRRMLSAQGDAVRDVIAGLLARPGTARVFVYGELFGGGYPHQEVSTVEGVQPVQTGIWYCPDIRFSVFDIRIETTNGTQIYLDFDETVTFCHESGLLIAPPLLIGTYDQATAYTVGFDSTIPAHLSLPPLPTGTNRAEGVVIKPAGEVAVFGTSGTIRPVLKRKLADFAEDRRFHKAEKWAGPTGYDGPLDLLKWEAYNRITANRWNAAVSKVGRDHRDAARELFVAEVFAESLAAVSEAVRESDKAALREYIRETSGRLTECS